MGEDAASTAVLSQSHLRNSDKSLKCSHLLVPLWQELNPLMSTASLHPKELLLKTGVANWKFPCSRFLQANYVIHIIL